jgi:hypothetical protein
LHVFCNGKSSNFYKTFKEQGFVLLKKALLLMILPIIRRQQEVQKSFAASIWNGVKLTFLPSGLFPVIDISGYL